MRRGLTIAAVLLGVCLAQNAFAQGRCAGGGGGSTGTGVGVIGGGGIMTGVTGTGVSPYQLAMAQAYRQQLLLEQQAYAQQQAAYAQAQAVKKERKLAVLRERRARETAGWKSSKPADSSYPAAAQPIVNNLSQAERSAVPP